MDEQEILPTPSGMRVEKKQFTALGEARGEVETHYDSQERVVFEQSTDFSNGAVNTVEYIFDNNKLRGEVWKDKEGRRIRYEINDRGERIMFERDPNFVDIDF